MIPFGFVGLKIGERMKRIQIILAVVVFAATLHLFACKDDGTQPPPIPERIRLTLVDVAVKEAYLHIAITNPAGNETLVVQRNGATVMTLAAVADTTIADTALAQTTSYQYTATLTSNNATTSTSNTISAQTLAQTSDNFTWQTSLLGDGNGSALYDVAIINDTLAYACGEIHLSGDPTAYNFARWNGQNWQLLRIQFFDFCGQPSTYPYPARAVFAFGANDVWITSGSQLVRWDGISQTTPVCIPVSINRLWGNSANLVYAVGAIGKIAYFNGSTWTALESGTRTQINDAWGITNPVTGKEEVYCPVTSFFTPGDKKILKITNHANVDSIKWEPQRNIFAVWTDRGFPLYTAGSGVFENSRGSWREAPLPAIYTNAVRGSTNADVVVAGDLGLVAHFNGVDWHVYPEAYNAQYFSVYIKGNMVALVGERNGRGVITIGRR
jgi:hypothetical protein